MPGRGHPVDQDVRGRHVELPGHVRRAPVGHPARLLPQPLTAERERLDPGRLGERGQERMQRVQVDKVAASCRSFACG